jgi:hypothetical protein
LCLDGGSGPILLLDDLGQEEERLQTLRVECDGAAEVFHRLVQAAPLARNERGHELDVAVVGCQRAGFRQPLGCLIGLAPLECDQTEIGPAGWLAGGELGDALKRRRGQPTLARLGGSHPPVESRDSLRVGA